MSQRNWPISRVAHLILLMSLGARLLCAEAAKEISVCELFDDMAKWNGQMVRFSARVESGSGEEGPLINALDCPAKIEISGVKFGNYLVFASPENALHSVDFELDKAANAEFARIMNGIDGKTQYLRLTIVGLFETRMPLSRLVVFTQAWPKGRRVGFGHLGGAPAQIIVKTASNMRIEEKSDTLRN